MTARSRTRLERVRASVGIALLRELIEDTDPPGGFMAAVAQLLTAAARRAEQIEPDRDGDASCPLHEAAALITDNAGMRLIWAAHPFTRKEVTEMPNAKATNPPRGQCTQCWYHAHASRQAHAALGPREDCPDCVDHMVNGHPDHMIVH